MIDQNLIRWVAASVNKHFKDRSQGLTVFVEGMNHVENKADYIELRLDGPFITQQSHNYYEYIFEINVFIMSSRNERDLYKPHRDEGIVVKAFEPAIQILKLGNGVDDDQSLIDCMTLVNSGDAREALRVSRFGQMDVTKPFMRSSVEGHYHLYLHG